MSAPETPIVATSSADETAEALAALVPEPQFQKNYATNEKAAAWVTENLMSTVDEAKAEGQPIREEWDSQRNLALMVRDDNAAYEGNSNAYLPVVNRALETRVSAASRALFPSDTYFDATRDGPPAMDVQTAILQNAQDEASKAYMSFQMEKSAKLRYHMKVYARQLLLHGVSYIKYWWEKPLVPVRKGRLTRVPGIDQILTDWSEKDPWCPNGFRVSTRSVFSLYVWPKTVNDISEATVVAEDIQVSKQFAQTMVDAGRWPKEVLDMTGSTSEMSNTYLQEGADKVGDVGSSAVDSPIDGDLGQWLLVTECWCRMPLPADAYVPGEKVGTAVPVVVTYVDDLILEVRRNPFWHQQPPYRMNKLNAFPDILNSVGMGRSMAGLQYLANDFMNQTNDNATYSLNPIIKYNPAYMAAPLEPLEPGIAIPMTDIQQGMDFFHPPSDQIQGGLMAAQQMVGWANDFGGAPPALQGTSSKGTAKTATGAQILEGNVKGEIQDLVEEIEQLVLEPLMDACWTLAQQYESEARWLAIAGGPKIQFTRDMLEARYQWKWVASSQAVNRAMRAQGLQQFAQIAAGLMPLLQMQGQTLDPVPLLRAMYEDGLGQRNFSAVIKPMPAAPMGPPGMGGPPGPPGQAGPQDPRSAVDQNPNGGGQQTEMVGGEGEAFGQVRQEANAQAAQAGAGMGFPGAE
ncbi:MAG: hypothetical protein QM729_21510 [Solirubrobacterales bacterium]